VSEKYFRRVGAVRPSHLMYSSGVGALVDLPRLAVLVRGLDDWDYRRVPGAKLLTKQRLLAAVRRELGPQVQELRAPPWLEDDDGRPQGPASLVGVPVLVFPQWLRCTYCNELAPVDEQGSVWQFVNLNARRPDLARFAHARCSKRGRKPLAVAARFVLACARGHLDDFPYREFVHRGAPCQPGARMRMEDNAGNAGPNVNIRCLACPASRNMMAAAGKQAEYSLPHCRGRHPHLAMFQPGHDAPVKMLVVGASNQWFARTLAAFAPWAPLVLLTYVDESYTDDWFAMAALLVDGPAAVGLTNELDRVAAAAAKAYGLGAAVELHGHEIFHAGGAWSGVPVRARIGVFDDVVEAVAAQDVRVIARAMDVAGQRVRYPAPDPPHTVVLQHLLERQETDERSRRAKVALWNRLRPRVQHELCWFPAAKGQGQQRLWGRDFR
jgi:hypothetical protein